MTEMASISSVSLEEESYGWVVVAASFASHLIQYGVVWTVGVFYEVFVNHFEDSSKATVALILSLNTATYYATGPIASVLTNRFGCRAVSGVGAILGCLGLILSMFAQSVFHLYITFGLLTGFGLGLAYIPSVCIVSFYFERRRPLALGLATSGVGVGTFIFPPILRYLLNNFGWRSSLLLTGGICLNLCVCAMLFRSPKHRSRSYGDRVRRQKVSGISEITGLFNLQICKDCSYLYLCINNLCICFGLSIVYVHLAAYASSLGYVDLGVNLLLVVGVSNFFGRLFFGFVANYFMGRVSPLHFYMSSFFVVSLSTFFVPLSDHAYALYSFATFFGFLTSAFGTLLPQILTDVLSVEVLANAYGYILFFEALGTLLGPPLAGLVYDCTSNYQTSFFMSGCWFLVSALLLLPVVDVCRRRRGRGQPEVPMNDIRSEDWQDFTPEARLDATSGVKLLQTENHDENANGLGAGGRPSRI